MIKKVDSGPSTPPQVNTAETEKITQSEAGATQPQSTTPTATPETPTRPYETGRQLSEHVLSGQMQAALLKSQIPGLGNPPGNVQFFGTGGGAPAGGTTSAPPLELKEGSTGPAVEEMKKQLNQWRAENGKTQITADNKFDKDTKTALKEFQQATGMNPDGIYRADTRDRIEIENNAKFKALDPDVKKQLRQDMNATTDPIKLSNYRDFATNPNLNKLSPEFQKQALKELESNPGDLNTTRMVRDNVNDRAKLETNQNFKNLPPDTQKSIRKKMDDYFTQAGGGARANTIALATDPNFGKLSRAQQDLAFKALTNDPGSAANTAHLQRIIGNGDFQNMDPGLKGRVLGLAEKNATNPGYMNQLTQLVTDAKFGKFSPLEQSKTLKVFEQTSPAGRIALQRLLQKEINGVPVLLSHGVNRNPASLLDNLERLSTSPLDSRFVDRGTPPRPIDRSQVTEQLMQELANPNGTINQDNRGTCTCTSISHRLAQRNPAEYARLATDLALTGQSKLTNGDTIKVPDNTAWQPDGSNRSHTERLLQSSLMNYAHPGYVNRYDGPDGRPGTADDGIISDPARPNQRLPDGWPREGKVGLNTDEQERVLKGLYGKSYTFYNGSFMTSLDKQTTMNKIKGELGAGRGPIEANLSWGGGGHAVEVTEVKNGRVYIRNPWGGTVGVNGQANGTAQNNTGAGPLRRVENGLEGIESMTIADFEKATKGIYVVQ